MSGENKKTILLVEDEVIIAMTETMTLEKFGYNVIMANSGEEAVATFEKTPGIDLILIDINLGTGIDGTEAAAIILRQRDLPVVFLSSHTEPEVVAKTEKITSYGYVVKDSSDTVLDASIKMAFKLFDAKTKEKEKESQMEAALAALRESEARLAEAQAVAKVGSWEIDLSNLNVIWSEETYRIFEIDPGNVHLTQAGFLAFTHPEDCAKVDAAFLGSLDTRSLNVIEHRIVTPGGLVKFIEERWRIFQDDQGRPVRAMGTCQDITERKQGESKREVALAALRESEEWNKAILQTVLSGVMVIEVATRKIVEVNDTALKLIGLPKEQVVGAVCHQFVCPAEEKNCPVLDLGQEVDLSEKILLTAAGKRKNIIKTVVPVQWHGRKYLMESFVDITERKRAEAMLQESEEKFRRITEQLDDVVYTSDISGTITYISPAAGRVFGWLPEEMIGKKFVEFLSEDEIPRALQAFQDALSQGKPSRNLSLKMKRRDSSVFIGEIIGSTSDKKQGIPGMLGLIRDITERKQAESQMEAALAALRESEERYRTLIENASDLVYRTDKAGHFTIINRAALTTTGYEERELIGMSYPTLIRPDMRNMVVKIFLHQIRKGTHNTYSEFPILTKDGREIWIGQNIQLIVQNGQMTGFQAVSRDITERKQAETIQHIQYTIANAMIKAETLSDFLETVRSELSSLIDTTNFLLALYDEASGMLSAPFEKDEKDAIPQWPAEKSLTGLVLKQKHSLLLCGEEIRQLDEAGSTEQIGSNAEAWLGVPLQINEKVLGAIVVQSYDNADAYDQSSVNLMEMIASQLSVYIERKQAEVEIQRQLSEKETLLKEVHHRIKNNIASIGGLLSLHVQSATNPEAIAVLQEAIGRVNSMRILYDKLLLSEGYKDISVKNYVESLVDSVVSLFPGDIKIKLDKRIADFHLDQKQLFPLGIIINELLTNIMKYAFINRDTGLIKISLINADNHVTLTIQDNGNGLPAGFDIDESKGFGLKLVKMLSQQLGGSFSIKKHAGTRSIVAFNI